MEKFCSQAIKELRIKNGMSQKALSENLGISNRAVSKWENGLSQPSATHIFSLSKIFNVPMDYFYGRPNMNKIKKPPFGVFLVIGQG